MRQAAHNDQLSAILNLLNSLEDEVVVLDSSGYIVASNSAWEKFREENGGDKESCSVGSNYMTVCTPADHRSSAAALMVPDGLKRTLQTGKTFRCEYPCDSPAEKRWFELTANRYQKNGRMYLIVQHRNITKRHVEQEEIEHAYINSNATAALIATTGDAIISYDLDGNILTWNPSAERLYLYTKSEILGRSLETLYPDDWPKRVIQYRDEIIAGTLQDFEATRIAKDGTEREVWVSCAPIRSLDGEIIAISNIHRDITDVRNAERARDLIANEVIHRAKNMLSVVLAIQRQTSRTSETLEEFNQNFGSRLASLSKSTDLLVHNVWTSVSLFDVVTGHLEPFTCAEDSKRVIITGPQVDLQPDCVQAIGMAIHELATNSAKYGALKQGRGKVEISWHVELESRLMHFRWLETGVLIKGKPVRKGFGNTVLTSHARSVLNAETTYEINDDSIEWTIDVPPVHFRAR